MQGRRRAGVQIAVEFREGGLFAGVREAGEGGGGVGGAGRA